MAKRAPDDIAHAPGIRGWPVVLLAIVLVFLASCATPTRLSTSTRDLRRELIARTGSRATAVVPFGVDADAVERARTLLGSAGPDARRLADLLGDPHGFGLRYEWATTGTARDTLTRGGGNCLALSSVLVGLARGLDLDAHYLEVRVTDPKRRLDGDLAVYADHVAAVVQVAGERIYVDYSGELGNAKSVRVISDVEAVAHYYTNLGYEKLHRAEEAHVAVPWAEVAHDFELSVRIQPDSARAWNNLGVARARLEDEAGARVAYDRALEIDAELAPAHVNLVVLHLRTNALEVAETHLDHARRLNPAHPQLPALRQAIDAARKRPRTARAQRN